MGIHSCGDLLLMKNMRFFLKYPNPWEIGKGTENHAAGA